jgi:hypothetical protein
MWISTGGLNGDGSSSLFEPTRHREMFPGIPFADEPIEVVVASLAGWAVDSGCYRIDGLWLDMQGGELDALKGAGPLLDGVTALVLEYSIVGLYDGAPLWLEVRGWLEAKGFEVVRETIDAGAPQGNALVAR